MFELFNHNNSSVIGKEYPMFQKPSGSHWGGSGSPRGGGTTPEWLHEPTANLHEKPGTKNTQNNLSIGKKNTKHAATANFQHAYQKHAPVWNITKQCHKLKMSEKKKVP